MDNIELKSGFATIIGLPNAGKSTFLNAVLNENIAITSNRPQTTRKNLKGIYNDDDSQIVFIDTPGIHKGKNVLDEYMLKSIYKSFDDIDLIIVIVDIMTSDTDNYENIINIVGNKKNKKILLINKIDCYLKENKTNDREIEISNFQKSFSEIINKIKNKFDGKINFDKTFLISSLKKKMIKDVISYLKDALPYGERFYDTSYITDSSTKQILADMIRKHCLYKLKNEIPHCVAITIDSMKKSKSKCLNIEATIVCEKESHKGIIIGKSGNMIKNIGTASRIEIEKFLDTKVNLKINVIVKNNWRTEKTLVKNFGYDVNTI